MCYDHVLLALAACRQESTQMHHIILRNSALCTWCTGAASLPNSPSSLARNVRPLSPAFLLLLPPLLLVLMRAEGGAVCRKVRRSTSAASFRAGPAWAA